MLRTLAAAAVAALAAAVLAPPAAQARPNFVVVMAEAQGWSGGSSPMDDANPASKSDLRRMPSLDRLCREGMRFASAYAASPRCTPSRAAFLTGRSPAALHMTFIGEGRKEDADATNRPMTPPAASLELAAAETTVAELLRAEGYATAHFGKWHVGRADPRTHGFDESDGATSNAGPGNNRNPNPTEGYGMADRGAAFVARQVAAGRPFYLQISHYAGRSAADALAETLAGVKARARGQDDRAVGAAAVAEDQDKALAVVLKKLDDLGVAGNTYVIYTADHGAPGRGANAPLTGGKGTVLEGGVRVPIVVRGPGVKPGACSHVRATGLDLMPTIADLAGVRAPLPKAVEGGSLAAVLKGGGTGVVRRPREEFVVHFPHYDHDNDGPTSAIYLGDLKLIRTYGSNTVRLFDLAADPTEQRDLSKQMPEKAQDLDRRLAAYLKDVDAQMAKPNPAYDPKAAPELLRPKKPKP
ncbi:MAG TPA: sulfatase-like hydrolase/transferase [Humisphaera sp.]